MLPKQINILLGDISFIVYYVYVKIPSNLSIKNADNCFHKLYKSICIVANEIRNCCGRCIRLWENANSEMRHELMNNPPLNLWSVLIGRCRCLNIILSIKIIENGNWRCLFDETLIGTAVCEIYSRRDNVTTWKLIVLNYFPSFIDENLIPTNHL